MFDSQVRRGIKLLDQRCPGWRDRVNARTLDMASLTGCVLGVLFGDFMTGLQALGLDHTHNEDAKYGFSAGDPNRYWLLNQEWREQLAA